MAEKLKRNKRLNKKSSHVGGAINTSTDIPSTHSSTNPYEMSDEEVRVKRAARENREDIAAAFGGY